MKLILLAVWMIAVAPALAETPPNIVLPPPPKDLGVDLIEALEQRRTTREFSAETLSREDLGAVLWAANGINRPHGGRTAPSAFGKQYIDIFVADDSGVYLYDASSRALEAVSDVNIKERVARQDHIGASSHVLVFVADLRRVPGFFVARDAKLNMCHSTAGAMAQNVHLMAAAKRIGTGMVAAIREEGIRKALRLPSSSAPLFVMPLGYLRK